MHLNFELDLYIAKLLIIVWLGMPYLALKYLKFIVDYTNKLEYLFLYLLYLLLVPAFLVFTLLGIQLVHDAIYQSFNILFLIW